MANEGIEGSNRQLLELVGEAPVDYCLSGISLSLPNNEMETSSTNDVGAHDDELSAPLFVGLSIPQVKGKF